MTANGSQPTLARILKKRSAAVLMNCMPAYSDVDTLIKFPVLK